MSRNHQDKKKKLNDLIFLFLISTPVYSISDTFFLHMHTNLTYHKSWGGPPAPAGWVGWGRSPWTSGTIHGSHSPAAAHSCQALPLWLQHENTNSVSDNNGSTLFSLMLAGALFNYVLCVCVCTCTPGPPTRWQWEWMSTSSPAVSEGTSVCQCDALSTGPNSITQCPASLSLSATLQAPDTHTYNHMVSSCKHKHVGHTRTIRVVENEATRGHKTNTWDRRLMKITLSLPSVYLCDSPSLIQSLTHSHTHIHDTLPHTLPWQELIDAPLPLYVSTRAPRNGCTSTESFFHSYSCGSFINEHTTLCF